MKADAIAGNLAEILASIGRIETTLKAVAERVISSPTVADEVLSTDEFLAELQHAGLKRSKDWLYDQVRDGRVKYLKHLGKPFQFLRSEKVKFLRGNHR